MPTEEPMTFMIEGAQIVFRNFAGEEGQYNAAGNREFSVILDPDSAHRMLKDGWNVKQLNPRDEGEEGDYYITITVGYKAYPPKIVMITSTGRTNITESTVASLDWAEIANADLIARAYRWEVGSKTGIKAYLKSLFVTVEEDELERKYGLGPMGD